MFIVFSEYIEITQADRAEAIRTAALNAAAVIDADTLETVADYRTAESESDPIG